MKNSGSLKNSEHAGTWIYRIMLNEIFRFLDFKKTASFEDNGYPEPQWEDTYEDIDLKRALDAIPPKDRAVIQLRYFEELKLDEIAQILGEKLSTVKSRLYRSLKKLKLELSDDENEGS